MHTFGGPSMPSFGGGGSGYGGTFGGGGSGRFFGLGTFGGGAFSTSNTVISVPKRFGHGAQSDKRLPSLPVLNQPVDFKRSVETNRNNTWHSRLEVVACMSHPRLAHKSTTGRLLSPSILSRVADYVCPTFQRIVSTGYNNPVRVWSKSGSTPDGSRGTRGHDHSSGTSPSSVCTMQIEPSGEAMSLASLQHGSLLIAVGDFLSVWDASTGALRLSNTELRAFGGQRLRCVDTSDRDGQGQGGNGLTVTGGKDVRVWDMNTGLCVRVLAEHTDAINSVRVLRSNSTASALVLSSSSDKTVKLWDTRASTHHSARTFIGHVEPVLCCDATITGCDGPDAGIVVSGGEDEILRVWDLGTAQALTSLPGHNGYIRTVRILPDMRYIASAGGDACVRIWETYDWKPKFVLEGHSQTVMCMRTAQGGEVLVTGSFDETIRVWNLVSRKCVRLLFNGSVATSVQLLY